MVASIHGINLVPVCHADGALGPDDLARICSKRRIHALYTMPMVHNPIGSTMDDPTRRAIAGIARRHDLLIVEDSA
ncbi:hypothetical protein [Breoghania sp.]|uniref:hypothetical protein n=1 Tax=Breoghania sp. TaxID=2065378 RepID=UPI0026375C57|nr:hypothetical protein [Breoghania sp.]MDJ0930694.1 hypothetical protein [Breoghania sp.]